MSKTLNRRRFFKLLGFTALPVLTGLGNFFPRIAEAADDLKAKMADEKDAMPLALQYSATAATRPKTKASESCGTCQQYTTKTKDVGTCLLFQALPKSLVPAKGWCSGFVKKA